MKIESGLKILLSEHIAKAAYVIDKEGAILSFNELGEDYLPEVSEGSNIFDVIETEAGNVIKQALEQSDIENEPVKKDITFGASGASDKYEFQLIPLAADKKKYFVFTIGKVQDQITRDGSKKFKFYTSDIESLISDENILNIINSIKSAYPFTFIGKSKFQKDIDKLDTSFWIKDRNGKFSIVNKRYANSLGLRVSQIEGQYEKELVPKFLLKLNQTIDNYIIETSNSVVVERENPGALKGKKEKVEIIEFPICDIDNNVVAIVGFSRIKLEGETGEIKDKGLFLQVFEDLDEFCFVTDSKGAIQVVSKKLQKYLNINSQDTLSEKTIQDLFGLELYKHFDEFINDSRKEKDKIEKFTPTYTQLKEELTVTFKKINFNNGISSGVLVLFKTTEEKITKEFSDKMYEAIMQNSPEAMFIYDIENLRFLEVNNAALNLYGYTRDQFLNMDLTDLYAPEDIQTLLDSSNADAMSGNFTGPWRHKKQNGDSVLVELSKTNLEFKERKSHLNVVRDVNERLENEKKFSVFKASFENSSDVILNTDADGFITYMNEQAVKSLGYSRKDFEGNSFLSIVGDDNRAEVSTEIFHSGGNKTVKKEIEIKKSSGDPVKASISATPIFNYGGDIDTFNIVIKLLEEKAEGYTDQTHEQAETKGALDASFLSNVFHEILTPINVIVGFVREITESIESPSEDQVEATEIINENQKMLLQLMDNAVEYSSLVQGKTTFKPEDIVFTELIDDIKSNVKRIGEENNVEFAYGKISSSLNFESDKQKIISLLTLFMKFAIQVTDESKVFLSAYLFDDDKCVISVKDDKDTISEKLLKGLKDILNEDANEIRRQYGFSRFIVKLTQKLLEVLKIENEALLRGGEPVEYALVVPLKMELDSDQLELESTFQDEAFRDKTEAKAEETLESSQVQPEPLAEEGKEKEAEHITEDKISHAHPAAVTEEAKTIIPQPFGQEVKKEFKEETSQARTVVQDASSININVSIPQQETPKSNITSQPVDATPVEEIPQKKGVELSNFSCLYVEDQVDSQILFKVQMKDLKSIEFATSFEQAVPFLKSRTFDFIVMDINLQGEYNGLDALRIIQKMPGYEHIPIIAVTAYVLPGDREKFIAAGFKDFISKPILREKLIDVLKGIFS